MSFVIENGERIAQLVIANTNVQTGLKYRNYLKPKEVREALEALA
jgi:dUTPase